VTGAVADLGSDLDPAIRLVLLRRARRVTPVAFGQLARLARDVDVVHAHMRSNAALVAMLRAVRLIRAPLVFHDHFGSIERDRSVPRWFRFGRRQISKYVGVYAQLAEWAIAAGMPPDRVTTIPNALDLRRLVAAEPHDLRGELGLSRDPCLAVLVASLRRDKGIEVLLDAVAHAAVDRLHVAIAGGDGEPAYAAEMRARAGSLGIADRVSFLGSRRDVPALLRGADIGLLSSHTESGPLVLIEYLAANLPIVATRVGDIGRHLAEHGVEGFVAAGDSAAFARELEIVVRLSSEARRTRGRAHRGLVDERWNLEAVMPRWYAVYADAMRDRS
jgi:glycosyltransferase involved in cell wall biosynthesis